MKLSVSEKALPEYKTVDYQSEISSSQVNYQDLMETLGVVKFKANKNLPLTLKDLKGTPKSDRRKLSNLGLPVVRKDAQMLIKWLDSMLGKIASKNESIEYILESALSIYETCFHEIVRQVSVQCKERGELINRVWKAYISLLERALRISQASQHSQVQNFKQEKQKIKAACSAEVFKLKCELQEKNLDILNFSDKLLAKEDEVNKFGIMNKRLLHRLEIIRAHYETVKKENIDLKEENRILKGKIINTETEFILNENGVIEARQRRVKLKRKDKVKLDEIVTKDPIIRSGSYIDFTVQEHLDLDIAENQMELEEIFTQSDFKDFGCDAPVVVTQDKESFTDTLHLCGESVGESKDHVDSTSIVLDLIGLNLQSAINQDENSELVRKSNLKQYELEKTLKKPEIFEKIYSFIDKMRQDIKSYTNPAMNSSFNPLSIDIKGSQSEFKPDMKRLKTIRQKMWGVIQSNNLKKTPDIISIIIQKVKMTPQHKLKKILVKKILLKFISMLYETKLQKRGVEFETSKKQDICSHTIEILTSKYGPGKIAENKFSQIASSCVKYRHIRRVKLFGRFLKLYDDLDNDDLETCLEFMNYTKSLPFKDYPNSDYSDQFLLTYEKAVDLYKSSLIQKLSDADKKNIKYWLEANKFTDSFYRTLVVDQDQYFEFIIDLNRSKKNARVNFLRCIYEAADLNDDGYLQQVEFDLLARHMSVSSLSESFAIEIFSEFAETFTDENEGVVQALSFENFTTLNETYFIFSIESMQNFSKITHSQGAIWHIKQVTPHIDYILQETRWRLSKKENWEKFEEEYDLVLSVIKNKVINQKNPESVWIALRLIQEESKLVCISRYIKDLLPSVQYLVITSTTIL